MTLFLGLFDSSLRVPEGSDFKDNSMPIAIFPTRDSPRLVSQRGVFTVHGIGEVPIDEVFNSLTSTVRERRCGLD
jgi:hypothetical protein